MIGLCGGLQSAHAQSAIHDPIGYSSGKVSGIVSSPFTVLGASVTASVLMSESSSGGVAKQALAAAALEDAAHYYQSGEIRGVLPAVLKRLRQMDPELARLENPALIDELVALAEAFISSQRQAQAQAQGQAQAQAKGR
ncbi:MAG: hypothetical protein ACK5QT_11485 [Oligoflexia bacterium]